MLLCRQITLSPFAAEWLYALLICLLLHQVVVAVNFIDLGFQSDFCLGVFCFNCFRRPRHSGACRNPWYGCHQTCSGEAHVALSRGDMDAAVRNFDLNANRMSLVVWGARVKLEVSGRRPGR